MAHRFFVQEATRIGTSVGLFFPPESTHSGPQHGLFLSESKHSGPSMHCFPSCSLQPHCYARTRPHIHIYVHARMHAHTHSHALLRTMPLVALVSASTWLPIAKSPCPLQAASCFLHVTSLLPLGRQPAGASSVSSPASAAAGRQQNRQLGSCG